MSWALLECLRQETYIQSVLRMMPTARPSIVRCCDVRSTWIGYQSSQSRLSYVRNQVEIARQFLRLAQKEVQEGRGQMMLVVNAQNALVNAQKDVENASTDFAVQVYSMLSQMNGLSLEALKTAAAVEAAANEAAVKQYQERLKKFQEELKEAQQGADNPPKSN